MVTATPGDDVKYVVRVVPRLWLLRRKTRTRIFQNMRVPDIVSAVLLEAGITTRWQLTRAYPVREYGTQYEETDYRFVRRILAESGIRKRLQHLGYQSTQAANASGVTEAELEARDRADIASFQEAQGLPPTGELDEATKAAIVREHGS